MNLQEYWEKALKKTEVVRPRVQALATYQSTTIPYVCLSESEIDSADTVVRRGQVVVEKPSIILPFNMPRFEGFDFEEGMRSSTDAVNNFFLVRGVTFPSMKYNHIGASMDIYSGQLSKAIDHHRRLLEQNEDVNTGLIAAPNDCWQFSILIFTASQIVRSAEGDYRRLLDDHFRDQHFN